MSVDGLVIPAELVASQPARFGVRSSRLPGNSANSVSSAVFSRLLAARIGAAGQTPAGAQLDSDPRPVQGLSPAPGATASSAATSEGWDGHAFADLITASANRYGLPPSLISAVISAESSGDPNAISPAGAMGLMQLIESTAASLGVTDVFDPAQNIDAGTRFLRSLVDQYGGDLNLALAAYNAGPGAVAAYGGVPPYQETQSYIANVLARYQAQSQ